MAEPTARVATSRLAGCEIVIEAVQPSDSTSRKRSTADAEIGEAGSACRDRTHHRCSSRRSQRPAQIPERVWACTSSNPAPLMSLREVVARGALVGAALELGARDRRGEERRYPREATAPASSSIACNRPFGRVLGSCRTARENHDDRRIAESRADSGWVPRSDGLVGVLDTGFEISKRFFEQSLGAPVAARRDHRAIRRGWDVQAKSGRGLIRTTAVTDPRRATPTEPREPSR